MTVTTIQCDVCHKQIGEDEVFKYAQVILWQDRDVQARAGVTIALEIGYSTPPNVCCKPCAASILRRAADNVEREVNPK